MASKANVHPSCPQETREIENCRENIPPRVSAAAAGTTKANVQVGGGEGSSEEKKPSYTWAFAAAKSQPSGHCSALTPIIQNHNNLKTAVNNQHRPHQSVPFLPFSNARSADKSGASVSWLFEERLPEMTLLELSTDSSLHTTRDESELPDVSDRTPGDCGQSTVDGNPPSKLNSTVTMSNSTSSDCQENTLDGNSSKPNSTISMSESTSGDCRQNTVDGDPPSKPNGTMNMSDNTAGDGHQNVVGGNVLKRNRTISMCESTSGDCHHSAVDGNPPPKPTNSTAAVSDNASGDPSDTTPPPTGRHAPAGPKRCQLEAPASSSGGVQVKSQPPVRSSALTPMIENLKLLKTAVSNQHRPRQSVPFLSFSNAHSADKTGASGYSLYEERFPEMTLLELSTESSPHTARDESELPGVSDRTAGECRQSTGDGNPPSKLNSTVTMSNSPSCDCQENTLDRNCPKPNSTISMSESTSGDCRQNTIDGDPPSKPNGTMNMSDNTTGDCHQNVIGGNGPKPNGTIDISDTTADCHHNTIEGHGPKANATVSMSESTSGDRHHNTIDTNPLPKPNGTIDMSDNTATDGNPKPTSSTAAVSDSTSGDPSNTPPTPTGRHAPTAPERSQSEGPPVELSEPAVTTGGGADTDAGHPLQSTFEANPASGAGPSEGAEGLSDTLGHQTMDPDDNKKPDAFNWTTMDDTLDLKSDCLITSTPMPKRFIGDGPSQPGSQAPPTLPSNIVCDKKTFLTRCAGKSLLPSLKAGPQPSKDKPACLLPGRPDASTSGLPVTRLRNQAGATAPQKSTGIPSTYNLRATTTGSKQVTSGLQRPPLSCKPSGTQRPGPGLRPPLARSHATASSSADRPCPPAASSVAVKTVKPKKHPLTRGEPLPVAKKKKLDADVPASAAETSKSSDTSRRGKGLKPPASSQRALQAKGRSHGCPNCTALEEENKMLREEIMRLTERLKNKQNEDC